MKYNWRWTVSGRCQNGFTLLDSHDKWSVKRSNKQIHGKKER
jgi:hypothetical protein